MRVVMRDGVQVFECERCEYERLYPNAKRHPAYPGRRPRGKPQPDSLPGIDGA
jgi:hypothetical protein